MEKKTSFAYLAIVAIVAIVALVVLITGNHSQIVLPNQNIAGEANIVEPAHLKLCERTGTRIYECPPNYERQCYKCTYSDGTVDEWCGGCVPA